MWKSQTSPSGGSIAVHFSNFAIHLSHLQIKFPHSLTDILLKTCLHYSPLYWKLQCLTANELQHLYLFLSGMRLCLPLQLVNFVSYSSEVRQNRFSNGFRVFGYRPSDRNGNRLHINAHWVRFHCSWCLLLHPILAVWKNENKQKNRMSKAS